MPEYVYAVTNQGMEGMVKIGTTTKDPEIRIAELFTTSVPFPFEPIAVVRVSDGRNVERLLGRVFGPNRVNPKREFFRINVEQVQAAMELLGEEADVLGDFVLDAEETDFRQEGTYDKVRRTKRPNLDFERMNILPGSKLEFAFPNEDEQIEVEVISNRKVRYEGEEMYLTPATQQAMNISKPVAPTGYWKYQGRLLKEIYDETFPQES